MRTAKAIPCLALIRMESFQIGTISSVGTTSGNGVTGPKLTCTRLGTEISDGILRTKVTSGQWIIGVIEICSSYLPFFGAMGVTGRPIGKLIAV